MHKRALHCSPTTGQAGRLPFTSHLCYRQERLELKRPHLVEASSNSPTRLTQNSHTALLPSRSQGQPGLGTWQQHNQLLQPLLSPQHLAPPPEAASRMQTFLFQGLLSVAEKPSSAPQHSKGYNTPRSLHSRCTNTTNSTLSRPSVRQQSTSHNCEQQ